MRKIVITNLRGEKLIILHKKASGKVWSETRSDLATMLIYVYEHGKKGKITIPVFSKGKSK